MVCWTNLEEEDAEKVNYKIYFTIIELNFILHPVFNIKKITIHFHCFLSVMIDCLIRIETLSMQMLG